MRFFHRTRNDALHAQIDALSRRLGVFERACSSAGLRLESAAGDGVRREVPPSLVAATRCPRPGGEPVRVDAGGVPRIAVVSGEGDPREWWKTLQELDHPKYAAPKGCPRVGWAALPEGLLAIARGGTGTAVWVSETLPAAQQRQAAVTALRAARRSGWRTGAVAWPVAALAARMAWGAVRAHAGAAMVSAGAVAAGTATVVTLAGAHSPPRASAPARRAPAAAPSSHRTARERRAPPARPSLAPPGRATHGHVRRGPAPAALGASPRPSGQPSPPPSPLLSPPVPSPGVTVKVSVSASASPGHKNCLLYVLGVCVKV